LENKHQIVIFGSAGCSANCPKKTCYVNISLANHLDDYDGFVSSCSKRAEPIIPREELGFVEYDIQPLIDLGFTRFKQMRPNPNNHFTYTH
jgi:hypothetical protein